MSNFPYVPLDPRGWKMAMGLRPLEWMNWLEVDEQRGEELGEKRRLLAERRDDVVVLDGCDVPASELRDDIARWYAEHRPDIALARSTNEHPLVEASRWTQEDLVVLERRDTWRLTGAVVCFPSRWDLRSKLGASLDEIHGPVPRYQENLSSPTNALFDRLTPDRSFWRLNWTLLNDPTLFQPSVVRRAPGGTLDEWFFRVERQTLRRLSRSDAVVFTIRTYVASAAELATQDNSFVPTLLANIETAPLDISEYKGWRGVAEHLASLIR